jgi:hypothetical protein
MISLPIFEVRIDMSGRDAKSYSQMFVGKPTVEEVLERIRSLPHEGYWLQLLTEHGLPEYLFTYQDHSEYIKFCQHMDVDIAQIKVIQHPSIPLTGAKIASMMEIAGRDIPEWVKEGFMRGALNA